MARKTRRRRKNKNSKRKSIKSMARKAANTLAAPVAFWSQLSQKDYQVLNASPQYQALDIFNKPSIYGVRGIV